MEKLPLKEKIGYGLGDAASNLTFRTLMVFLTYYYTDVYGINPATVGTIFQRAPVTQEPAARPLTRADRLADPTGL